MYVSGRPVVAVESRYTPNTVSKELPKVTQLNVPVAVAVHLYHTDGTAVVTVASLNDGSVVAEVAPAAAVVTTTFTVSAVRVPNASFTGGGMITFGFGETVGF